MKATIFAAGGRLARLAPGSLRAIAAASMIAGLALAPRLAAVACADGPPPPPPEWGLTQSCPDPFCPDTTLAGGPHLTLIDYQLQQSSSVTLEVLSLDSATVLRTAIGATQAAGRYQVSFDGRDGTGAMLADGDYPYRLTAREVSTAAVLFEDMRVARVRCGFWWSLGQNDPDAFCPAGVEGSPQGTSIFFRVPQTAEVHLEVWSRDSSHVVRTLVNGMLAAGQHVVSWDGRDDGGGDLANGAYPYGMTALDLGQSCVEVFHDAKVATLACAAATPEPRPGAGARIEAIRPNPFRDAARFDLRVSSPARVRITILDVSGRPVRVLLDEPRPAGAFSASWDGRDDAGRRLPPGAYFLRVEAGAYRGAGRLLLLR